ncbi:coagulation factor 5/8 type domain-containing protein [Paenibacillus terrae HPL-003]|uniref:Coagulation factor 5/8 type domain-containing protein n=1 Tax=Paenibacillus terrae (strain HPL-003) TaxID=985665 RepID=G7VXP7_PAETH|nr:fibronectin type III domain-containing protein [Paenibacillus terrae]AET59807.1 coagulation factor 5/8 type domain-containing protein [Paenibacillus terrae HPL-003]
MKYLLIELGKKERRKIAKPVILTMLGLFVFISLWSTALLPQEVSAAFTGGIPINIYPRPDKGGSIGPPEEKPTPSEPSSTHETVALSDGSIVHVQASSPYITFTRNNVVVYTKDLGAALSVKFYSVSVSSNAIKVNYFYKDEWNGAKSSGSFTYSGIVLTTPASPHMSSNITGMTNQNVLIQLDGVPSNYKREYKIGVNGTWTPYNNSFQVSENTTIFARCTDHYGNISAVNSLVINNIDKTPPAPPSFSHSPANEIANSIRVTINYPSDAASREYRVNQGTWKVYNSPVDVNEYGMRIQARAIDSAGNVSQVVDSVMNLINRAPAVIKAIPATTIEMDEGASTKDLSEYFADPDQQQLRYSGVNSSSSVVTHQFVKDSRGNTSILNLQPQSSGESTITITATDPLGKSVSQSFVVKVLDTTYVEQLTKTTAAVVQAETSKLQVDVTAAVELINKLRDPDKSKLVERLVVVQKIIDVQAAYAEQLTTATQAVVKAETSNLQTEINIARALLVNLNEEDKQQLNGRLDRIPAIDDLPKDITSPSKPKKLTGSRPAPDSIVLTWEASTDNVGVVGYDVYRNGQMIGNTKELTFQVKQLEPQKIYMFAVKAKDAAGNYSESSNIVKSGLSRKYKYIYDANGRLEHIEQDGHVIFQYQYDSNGNLIQIKE